MRFLAHGDWALIPGPAVLLEPMDSQDCQELATHAPCSIAKTILQFPRMVLIHPAEPSWLDWKAEWKSGNDYIIVGMALFEDELQSWGGSEVEADCGIEAIMALWIHVQSRLAGIWLHAPDCTIHTYESFRKAMGA